ncbi:MAG: RNA-binding protein [Rhodospirillaceae bacterium]
MDGGMVPIGQDADPDDGAEETRDRRDPLRRCIVTGTVQPKVGMIRFVVSPEGAVVPDLDGTLPGRGLWLTAERAVVERAMARNQFAKAARRAVRVEPDLLSRLTLLLERRCLDLIGLARRAGQAVAGFEKVREALQAGRVCRVGAPGLLLAAADGAADGRSKLRGLAGQLPVLEAFESKALGAALGRDITVHALIARGALADRLRVDAGRLMGLRTLPAGRSPAGQPINDGPVGYQ